jgi:hypothetical protein
MPHTSSTALKCSTVGVAKALLASCIGCASRVGPWAISVSATNCSPMRAPADEPAMT